MVIMTIHTMNNSRDREGCRGFKPRFDMDKSLDVLVVCSIHLSLEALGFTYHFLRTCPGHSADWGHPTMRVSSLLIRAQSVHCSFERLC